MKTIVFLHDGSLEGILNAVALAVKDSRQIRAILKRQDYVPVLFDTVVTAASDREQAERLLAYLEQVGGRAAAIAVNACLSEKSEVGLQLYDFVRLCLRYGRDTVHLHSNSCVRYLDDLCRKVSFEAHRQNGLIRFRVLADELLYAPFQADYNVIGYCAGHFRRRLASRRWILHDVGRNIALFWNMETLQPVGIEQDMADFVAQNGELPPSQLTDDEQYYQHLWRGFHTAVSQAGRENRVLQRQLMPRRYWKYLVEIPE